MERKSQKRQTLSVKKVSKFLNQCIAPVFAWVHKGGHIIFFIYLIQFESAFSIKINNNSKKAMHPTLIISCFSILVVKGTVACLLSDAGLAQIKYRFMTANEQRELLGEGRI